MRLGRGSGNVSGMAANATPQISMHLRTFHDDPQHGWEGLLRTARAMDAAGIDRLAVSDHVVFGDDPNQHYANPATGGTAGGKQPTGPDGQWLEPLTVLTAVAAQTNRIRLATGILLAALRRPVVLAKTLATLDVLSGGRVDLGVGVGWQPAEYEAAGLDFTARGALLDHSLDVCCALWTEQAASYASPELTFDGIHQMPKPLQAGGVPIWTSGTVNKAVVRRLCRYGMRWIPWGPALTDLPAATAQVRDDVAAAGGDADGLQVQGNARTVLAADGRIDVDATMTPLPALVAAGVTDFRFHVGLPDEEAAIVDLLRPLVEAFHSM